LDKHYKSGPTLDESGDVTVLPTREKVTFPVPRYCAVLDLRWPLSDGYGVNDLSARLSSGGGCFAPAHQPSSAKPRDELFSQYAAGLDEQALVDCFVGYPHRIVVGIFSLQPAGYLLRRPIIVQFLRHHHLQGAILGETTLLWTAGGPPRPLISIGGPILSAPVVPSDFAADR
jgi:hypothetical protein